MQTRRFQILISLQVALQLLIPAFAPWLHSVVECGSVDCCTSSVEAPQSSRHAKHGRCPAGCSHEQSVDTNASPAESADRNGSDHQKPHDCAHCAICQAIAAPRILASVVEISEAPEQIVAVVAPACADPLLGFGLPPQCRAPPLS